MEIGSVEMGQEQQLALHKETIQRTQALLNGEENGWNRPIECLDAMRRVESSLQSGAVTFAELGMEEKRFRALMKKVVEKFSPWNK